MSEMFHIKSIEQLFAVLAQLVNLRVSDIFITADRPLEIRKVGEVLSTTHIAPTEELIIEFLNATGDIKIEGLLSDYSQNLAGQLDGAISIPTDKPGVVQRFRYNLFRILNPDTMRQTIKVALRPLSDRIPTPDELGISDRLLQNLDAMRQGLVLVCGKTGQGKSTSLASILQHRASKFKEHIVTLEQPIEYIIRSHISSISQREVGISTETFASGLRAALRQAPRYHISR